MSALSDYYVTGDIADLEEFRRECRRDEIEYEESLREYEEGEDE